MDSLERASNHSEVSVLSEVSGENCGTVRSESGDVIKSRGMERDTESERTRRLRVDKSLGSNVNKVRALNPENGINICLDKSGLRSVNVGICLVNEKGSGAD